MFIRYLIDTFTYIVMFSCSSNISTDQDVEGLASIWKARVDGNSQALSSREIKSEVLDEPFGTLQSGLRRSGEEEERLDGEESDE